MRLAVARHDTLVQRAVEANHGAVVKRTGDGVHAAFADPLDAVGAAVRVQQAPANPEETNGLLLSVRCGVHVGADEQRDNDFFAGALNRATRIMSAAHGGQVLLSQAVVELLAERLPANLLLLDLGAVHLRDLPTPGHISQLVHPQLRQVARLAREWLQRAAG